MTSHSGQVNALVQINQNQVATAGNDGEVRIWDIATKTLILTYSAHVGTIQSLVALPGGQLASGATDKTIRVWDMQTQTASTVNVADCVNAMLVDPTGTLLVLMNNMLAFYDSSTLNQLNSVSIGKYFDCIEILLPSRKIALGGASLDLYSTSGGLVSTHKSHSAITKLKQLPDNLTLVCGLKNGDLILFNSISNSFGPTFAAQLRPVTMLSMTPDLLYIVSCGEGAIIKLWLWRATVLINVKEFTIKPEVGDVLSGLIIATKFTGKVKYLY
jgi:WD40 repeat protein